MCYKSNQHSTDVLPTSYRRATGGDRHAGRQFARTFDQLSLDALADAAVITETLAFRNVCGIKDEPGVSAHALDLWRWRIQKLYGKGIRSFLVLQVNSLLYMHELSSK